MAEPIQSAEPDTVTLSFTGDFTLGTDEKYGLSGSFIEMHEKAGKDYFLENMRGVFAGDDYTVVNLEGPLTTSNAKADKEFAFRGKPEFAKILTSGYVEAVNLSNNHTYDYGTGGLNDTIKALDSEGIDYYGDGRRIVKDVKGIKVGLAGYKFPSDSASFRKTMKADLDYFKSQNVDVKIATFHWGIERNYTPEGYQQSIARYAIDNGADLIVGHHPHVLQTIEVYKDKPIVYSLGNFCFGGNRYPSDKDTMVFQMVIDKSSNDLSASYRIVPCQLSSVTSRNDFSPIPVTGERAEQIKEKLLRISSGYNATGFINENFKVFDDGTYVAPASKAAPAPTATPSPTPTPSPSPTPTPTPDPADYIFPEAASLPFNLIDNVSDVDSAVQAVSQELGTIGNEKAVPANADLLTLFAEAAVSNAATKIVQGESAIIDNSLADLAILASRGTLKAEAALILGGVPMHREIRREARIVLPDATKLEITIKPSAADLMLDKIRVEAPFASAVISSELIKSATADGSDYVVTISQGDPVAISSNKEIAGTLGLSVKTESKAFKDETGKTYAAKRNPARDSYEFTASAWNNKADFAKADIPLSFTDIANLSEGLKLSVEDLASSGLINGISDTEFGPDQPVTRAQLAQLLMSALGRVGQGADGGFTDIPADSWAKQAADSAKSLGVISGFEDGTFRPDDAVTREQAFAIAARILSKELKYRDVSSADTVLAEFGDAASISSHAKDDIAKAFKAGLFNRSATGLLNPQAAISRAEAAVLLRQLFSKLWI
jgi:poly-gamma-glutamate synthesis protein (capsule biosynthesis protein)